MSVQKYKVKEKAKRDKKRVYFSIEKTVLDDLQQEAEQKMESVNTLVNQILKSYLQWHKLAKKARLAYISKDLMAKTIDHLSDEQIIQMTEEFCKKRLVDIIHMLRDENTFESFMEAICLWFEVSGFNYRLERNDEDDTDLYIIQFDMGRKWSLYFKMQMQLVFEYYNVKNAKASMTNNAVLVKINRKL
ncbi:MAG: hypothetical protein ACTHJ7_04030 [Candidatus Nitrosocosmicus sp.]